VGCLKVFIIFQEVTRSGRELIIVLFAAAIVRQPILLHGVKIPISDIYAMHADYSNINY
jgi:hypothetical protein